MTKIKEERKDKKTFKKGKPKKIVSKFYKIMTYILLIDLAFVFLFPFIYMIMTSFKSYNDLLNVVVKWIPTEFSPENWATAFKLLKVKETLPNSIFVTLLSTVGHLFACSFIGYGFARFKFPGSKIVFALVLLSIIIPIQTIIIPVYLLFSNINWVESYKALIVPTFFGFGLKGGLFIFLFRQSYLKMPKALEEAASIDGCNPFSTYFRVALPTAGPMFLVVTVLSVVWHWNDYFEPSIYLRQKGFLLPQMLPKMYEMIQMMKDTMTEDLYKIQSTFHEGLVMAGTAIAIVPLIIFFLIIQRKFMQSVVRSGIVE